MMKNCTYQVNGLPVEARFEESDEERIFLPLLHRLTQLRRERGRRVVAFLAGPPAAGKSTLCCHLEALSRSDARLLPLQAAGIDGFHYPQAYLEQHEFRGEPLSRIKGAPETYDVAKLQRLLQRLNEPGQRWPVYDRRLHEPVEGALEIREEILLLEGNWLLLDEEPWRQLRCDYSVFLRAGDPGQLERIVARKVAGGFPEAEARAAVQRNDRPNIQRCLAHSRRAELTLVPRAGGGWEKEEG